MYSEKATNFCQISTVDLSYAVMIKSTVEIVAFSEYMNFKPKSRPMQATKGTIWDKGEA